MDGKPHTRRRRRIALVFAVSCALLGAGGSAVSARGAVPADWAGVNAQWLFPALPPEAWGVHLDGMRSAGIRVVRLDAEWRRVEPDVPLAGVHAYRWDFYDRVVGALAARGIRWYPIVDYSAPWAASIPGQWRSPPASIQAYATYAAALAARYGAGGAFWAAHPELPALPVRQWEIWNEENGAYFWGPAPDPARYADLYMAARAAIRAHDPSAQAVVGGLLARGAGDFLAAMLAHRPDARTAIDAVGLHTYGRTVAETVSAMVDVRNWLVHLGAPATPIEVTETGWTTSGSPTAVTDARRADELRALLPAAAALPGVSRLIVHTWTSRERSLSLGEDWYGLVHPDGTPTASATAFAEAWGALRQPARPSAPAKRAKPRQRHGRACHRGSRRTRASGNARAGRRAARPGCRSARRGGRAKR
jgi:hypothetical protein